MAGDFAAHFGSVGLIIGALCGLLFSPFVLLHRAKDSIFAIVAMSFTAAFPIAIIAGFFGIPWLAIILTACTVLGVFFLLIKAANTDNSRVYESRLAPAIFLICTVLALAFFYSENRLPQDPTALVEMLAVNDVPTQFAAGHKLMRYGKDPFLVALRHPDYRVRGRAAHFLGLLGDKSVVGNLITASQDKDPYVRSRVAFALGKLKDKRAVPALLQLSKDSDKTVRVTAEEALREIDQD